MKKTIAIIVLGLLWSNVGHTVTEMNNCLLQNKKHKEKSPISHENFIIDLEKDRIYRKTVFKPGRSPFDKDYRDHEYTIIEKRGINYTTNKFKHSLKPEEFPNHRWQLELHPKISLVVMNAFIKDKEFKLSDFELRCDETKFQVAEKSEQEVEEEYKP